jgi:hypothetical protein
MIQMTIASRQTIDQRRANHAWQKVVSHAKEINGQRSYDEKAKEYAREAKKLPMRIMAA